MDSFFNFNFFPAKPRKFISKSSNVEINQNKSKVSEIKQSKPDLVKTKKSGTRNLRTSKQTTKNCSTFNRFSVLEVDDSNLIQEDVISPQNEKKSENSKEKMCNKKTSKVKKQKNNTIVKSTNVSFKESSSSLSKTFINIERSVTLRCNKCFISHFPWHKICKQSVPNNKRGEKRNTVNSVLPRLREK